MKKNLNKGLCKNYKIKKRQILSVAILLTIFLSTPVYAQGTNNVNEVGIEINMGSGMTAEKLEYYKQKIQYSKLPKQLLNCGISLEKDEINKISSIIKEEFETNNYLLNTITTRNVIDKNGKETESVTKDNNKQSLKYKGKFTFLEDTREYKGDMSSTLLKSNIAIHYQIKGKVVVGMFYDEAGNYFMFVRYDANAAGVSASDQDMYNKLGTKSFESAIIVPLN